jgi:PAS domain S-box-containing protein
MIHDDESGKSVRVGPLLPAALVAGFAVPLLGALGLNRLLPAWSWSSLPFHSTLEMGGALLGLVLAVIILFSRQKAQTSRRMWIACALIAMAMLDIFHGSARLGDAFVWLHGLATLAGGLLFAPVWFPERGLPRATALAAAGATLLFATLLGCFIALFPASLPATITGGKFAPVTIAVTLLGGGMLILAAVNFAVRYAQTRQQEEMLFLMVCLLFGMAGLLFPLSALWRADWWFWHLLRFGAYLFAFWLAMLSYRRSENEMIRAHDELDRLFHVAIDGKRLVDRDFNQLRTNDPFIELSGLPREAVQQMKCHEAFHGPMCGTGECPIRQFETGPADTIEREVTKTRRDGRQVTCILKAVRLNAPDGSFRGIIESFLDITDRKRAADQLARQAALKSAQAELSDLMRGDLPLDALARNIISFLCRQGKAQTGLMYLADEDGTLRLAAGHAHKPGRYPAAGEYKPGEGLVGQAVLEKKEFLLADVPENYFPIESGLGAALPRYIFIKPIVRNGRVKAVIELGTLHTFEEFLSPFLHAVTESIAMAVESAESRTRLAEALAESQQLTEELQAQQEELRSANEELEEQTRRLQESEEQMKVQQEELQTANAELEEKNELLERQTMQVELSRRDIEEKAGELALASRYKSEFLANMSHELRTPLNSLLLLAQGLVRNPEGNLTGEQVESARIIHGSGTDLLNLINEILDLSKIEAGRIDPRIGPVQISDLAEGVRASFQHVAREKGLDLEIVVSENAPACIASDRQRVEQVIRNLTANAVKFTETGTVTVTFCSTPPDTTLSGSGPAPDGWLAVTVRDTGIGIAPEQHQLIFEAFRQGDGGTGRKYGGTGLGLSISAKLAALLGGEIRVESTPGQGSAFTLYLPAEGGGRATGGAGEERMAPAGPRPPVSAVSALLPDDRDHLAPAGRVILIIEDDPVFARLLCDKCREKGCRCLAAQTGEAGLELAAKHLPDAVILDIRLPAMDGWAVLGALKENPRTRRIPVHIVSVEQDSLASLRQGAISHLTKPVRQEELEELFRRLAEVAAARPGHILLVDADAAMRRETARLIGANGDPTVDEAGSGAQALEALRAVRYDCVILDLALPDMEGGELLARLEQEGAVLPPVIVHTARDLSREEEAALRERAESIIIKDARSRERLLDEVTLFLLRVMDRLAENKRKPIPDLRETDTLFKGRKVLVVDDDMRTTFAVSRLLAEQGMLPLKAENGERALRLLEEQPDTDLVLMDIMMPVMDGLETMRQIRSGSEATRGIPIIALTAKAMPEDREKCLAAGANDYLPKPLDERRLFSMMRVWLGR